MLQEERCLRYLWIICQSTVVAFRPLFKKIRKFFRCLNAKVCYKSRGALGTSGSFVNQPAWHSDLFIPNSLSCSRCSACEQKSYLWKALIIFFVFITREENVKVCISFLRSKPSSFVAVNSEFETIRFTIT